MPRLSVDIDLTYLPIESRAKTILGIHKALLQISKDVKSELKSTYPKIKVVSDNQQQKLIKLIIFNGTTQVKVEPNFTIRGEIFKSKYISISESVKNEFGLDLETKVMSIPDIYGGKICAALDRQHPRDLFDVKYMLEKYGLSEQIRQAFVVYLISHSRPMAELLKPNFQNINNIFENQFKGMAKDDVSCDELIQTRELLVKTIHKDLTANERNFLISIKLGEPRWDLLPIKGIDQLPAVKWKLQNLKKMDANKHTKQINNLKKLLEV